MSFIIAEIVHKTCFKLLYGQRPVEIEALSEIAVVVLKELNLFLGLHALGDTFKSHFTPHSYNVPEHDAFLFWVILFVIGK